MVISCCDLRVHVTSIFGADTGEFFIHRNIANLVPAYAPDGEAHGTSAAVEYAVTTLKVAHLIVMGHSQCGGVAGCHAMCSGQAPELDEATGFVGRWMDILRPGYERVKDLPADQQIPALERAAVEVSLDNLMTFPFVASAVEAEELTLHGLLHDIRDGAAVVAGWQGWRRAGLIACDVALHKPKRGALTGSPRSFFASGRLTSGDAQPVGRGKEHRLRHGRADLFFGIGLRDQERGLWPVASQQSFREGGDEDHRQITHAAQQFVHGLDAGRPVGQLNIGQNQVGPRSAASSIAAVWVRAMPVTSWPIACMMPLRSMAMIVSSSMIITRPRIARPISFRAIWTSLRPRPARPA